MQTLIRRVFLVLVAAGLFIAAPAAAQSGQLLEQSRPSTQNALTTTPLNVQASSVTDAFVLTNASGDTLFVAADNGKVFVGSPDKYFGDSYDENFYSHMTRPSGNAGAFYTTNVENSSSALYVRTEGPGITGYFRQANDTTRSAAVLAQTTSMGAAGGFEIYNAQNTYSSVFGMTRGLGPSGNFNIQNTSNASAAVWGKTDGTGNAGRFEAWNSTSEAPALHAGTSGIGAAAYFERNGDGGAFGPAVQVVQQGNGNYAPALTAELKNSTNSAPALAVTTLGTGNAGNFGIDNTSSNAAALQVGTNGTGPTAQFYAGGQLRTTIANNGDIFTSGTITGGGADVAEAFEVEGAVAAYEPGDVLVISTERDRTVTRSGEAYSTRVVGVYATQPGVLLSEKGMETRWAERVPMGVIGVIPTKVTLEGGAIERGDLLVTSSTPGRAMKADLDVVGFGQVIGKALQPYDGSGPAVIEVLVNVK
jgi:hypothetical protein